MADEETEKPRPGEFCERHWSWLCQAGQGQCRESGCTPVSDEDRPPIPYEPDDQDEAEFLGIDEPRNTPAVTEGARDV